ncbi:hypothetical protein HK26_03975 [Acetobacter okinawensis]|uniref:Rap1a immunity protein domain-containing protein n=1 Tax=Acetobacter okinawensis TaxID=1076594 RepID=A0A252BXY4_9PROT|nr:hypothetical protein HK26_03975 [Acetobacter okinawensis]
MLRALLLIAFFVFSRPAMAQDVWPIGAEFGLIISSCQSYLNSYQNGGYSAYEQAALGYFSAINAFSVTKNKNTGSQTNAEGILGEIKLYCVYHPSDQLSKATLATYAKMLTDGK